MVSVPVLSNTATVVEPSCSSAPPCLTMICRRAARLMPPMIAMGVARMSGHGVATTSTASARRGSPDDAHATAHTASVIGVNHTAYRSASRCSGALLACAVRTSWTMRAYWLSSARASARMVSGLSPFALPLMRRVPSVALTGTGSPVSRDVSTCERPLTTVASHGTSSPGLRRRRSPGTTAPAAMSSTWPSSRRRCATRGAASSSARTAADARPSA